MSSKQGESGAKSSLAYARSRTHSRMPVYEDSRIARRGASFSGHSGLAISAFAASRSSGVPARTWRQKLATSAPKPSSCSSVSVGRSTLRRISRSRNLGGSTPSSCVMTLFLVSRPAQTRPKAKTSRDLRSLFLICFVSAQPHISGARHQPEVTRSESFLSRPVCGVIGGKPARPSFGRSAKPWTDLDMPKSQRTRRTVNGGLGPRSTRRFSGLRSRWMIFCECM
mmetsp:Transcript_101926/g.220061  ORF Transcript_101926/g.220061 Transcript_101926/m.220061 type:complete len:225 (+) Transcript_101926:504-1178(+)